MCNRLGKCTFRTVEHLNIVLMLIHHRQSYWWKLYEIILYDWNVDFALFFSFHGLFITHCLQFAVCMCISIILCEHRQRHFYIMLNAHSIFCNSNLNFFQSSRICFVISIPVDEENMNMNEFSERTRHIGIILHFITSQHQCANSKKNGKNFYSQRYVVFVFHTYSSFMSFYITFTVKYNDNWMTFSSHKLFQLWFPYLWSAYDVYMCWTHITSSFRISVFLK